MISVCMATYNGATYIEEQLQSILAQLSPQDELIVSDDGSTDGTIEILKRLNDRRIQVFQSTHGNLIKNFENALRKASGDYIFLSDQDDIWHPDKVKICVAALEKGASLVVSDCTLVDATGSILDESYFRTHPPRRTLMANIYKNSFMGCCMAFDKNVLQRSLPFPSSIPMHDSWIGAVALASREPVVFLNEKLVLYRRHGAALSTTGSKSKASIFKKFSDRANLAGRLALRRLGLA